VSEHYFSSEPATEARTGEIELTVAGRALRLTAGAGVFSAGRLDPGTAVLLRKAPLPVGDAGPLLDLGCGYGPIACALATVAPGARIYAVDVNRRALDLVRENARRLALAVTAAEPDEVPADLMFSGIWSNPPIRIGKPALHELLDRWLPRLRPDGAAWLVAARHLGGDSLADWLAGRGWSVARQASQKGYRVLRVSKSAGAPDA
jgi:16S rRNA G1207 methylase RsmC